MTAWGDQGVLDRPSVRVMNWRNGALFVSDLAHEPGVNTTRTYHIERRLSQPGLGPV